MGGAADARQKGLRRIDGRLHLLLGHIDIQAEVELHHDDRSAVPELVEVIWLRPCNWPNWRSSGAVTVVATTSGLAPG